MVSGTAPQPVAFWQPFSDVEVVKGLMAVKELMAQ
jgi:hypothetical protein